MIPLPAWTWIIQFEGSRSRMKGTTFEIGRLTMIVRSPHSRAWNSVRLDQNGSASDPLENHRRMRRAEFLGEPSDLPGDRRGVVLVSDRQHPGVFGQIRAFIGAKPRYGRLVQDLQGHRPRARGVHQRPGIGKRIGVVIGDQDHRGGFRGGSDLECHLRDDAECPQRAGQELRQVVAGDVLDDPAAALDLLAVGGDEADADDHVARSAGAEAAGAAGVAREDASQGGPSREGCVEGQVSAAARPGPNGGPRGSSRPAR